MSVCSVVTRFVESFLLVESSYLGSETEGLGFAFMTEYEILKAVCLYYDFACLVGSVLPLDSS